MDAACLEKLAADFTLESPLNQVVIEQSGEALTLFDPPLLGYARAMDPLFEVFLAPGVIGPHYRTPRRWLAVAETVVLFPAFQPGRASPEPCRPVAAQPGLALRSGGGPAICGSANPASAIGAPGRGL